MASRVTLITIVWVCCIVYKADAVSWTTDPCPPLIPEDTPKENIYVFMADGSPSGYTILTQNVTDRFLIAKNGTLSSATKLDYESNEKVYSLEIMAFNNTGTPQNANLTCEIRVTDVNDEQPQFVKQSYSVNIANDVENDTNVLNVSATDADLSDPFKTVVYSVKEFPIIWSNPYIKGNGFITIQTNCRKHLQEVLPEVVYQNGFLISNFEVVSFIEGGDRVNFTINKDTGVIKAANNLTGPHTFKITVIATDSGNSNFTDEASVSMCIRCTSGTSSLEISIFALMALVFGVVLM